jgi:hypothetical protein
VSEVPGQVQGIASIAAISSGDSHTLALTTAGTIVAWGGNGAGQLGDGTTVDRYSPVAIPGLINVSAVAAGGTHSLALGLDGNVYAWGRNYSGELGDGTNDDRARPAIVPGLSDIVAIGAGGAFSFAVKRGGTVYAWGANWAGQLGDDTGLSMSSPVPLPLLRGIRAISGGGGGALALKSDGTVYSWGDNIDGRVGDGTLVSRNGPVIVVREDGAGTLEANNWFLDLDPAVPKVIPPEFVPIFLVVAQNQAGEVTATLKFRGADIGATSSVFVFAMAPQTVVHGAVAKDARFTGTAAGSRKDDPVSCALAQLNAQGQLVSVSASSLQAYVSGVLSAQGQAVKVLGNVSTAAISGATFYVGYGPNGSAMLTSGTTRGVVSVPGSLSCRPQAPQTGWWFNPAEGGRGFSIEARGNRLFMAAFHYEADGRPTWNFAGGATSLDGSLFTADFVRASGGQTLTGAHRLPGLEPAGSITLAFSDATHGTMFWPGGSVAIERQPFVSGGLTMTAQAGLPESGWWWNPAESGRGFFIEWQGGFADIAGYMYDAQGRPTWYISALPTPDPLRITGNWWTFANGQAMGQPYRAATRTSDNAGALDVQFSSSTTATMTLPDGRRIPLVRQAF